MSRPRLYAPKALPQRIAGGLQPPESGELAAD
jgi:hypothetical protein